MQKNNMGIIGIMIASYVNKIRIMGESFVKCCMEGITGKILSIFSTIGSGLGN